MNPSDPLRLDEHLARVLAAYDQGIGEADGKAPTLDVAPVGVAAGFDPSAGPAGSAFDVLPDDRPAVPFPSGFAPPPRIGRFELRRQLGKGGCGIVFLADDPKLGREVAVKVPRPEMLMSPDARRRLLREARAAAEFDHPNLVPVFETGEIGPVCYLATAFCPGQTLAEWLDRQAFPVPVRQAARLVAQLAEAVQHAHDRGVLHRDLKPNNVILQELKPDPNGGDPPVGAVPLRGDFYVPKVLDFGLAKMNDAGPQETATRQVVGTPKYMAPEQAQARHDDVGPAADVYALGAILYELVAGRAPYDGETDVEVLRQVVDGNLTPPRSLRKDLHRDLEAICLKAMAKTPARRYRTAIDLADDLRRFLDGRPTVARPLNALGRSARWLRRNDGAVAVGVVTTIGLFFLTLGVWRTLETRQLRSGQSTLLAEQAERDKQERRREYARQLRAAFLSWRNGDAQPMADALAAARAAVDANGDNTDFPWRYLSQLGRVERRSLAAGGGGVADLAAADGPRLVSAHPDGTLAVWDRAGGGRLGEAKAGPGAVARVVPVGRAGVVTAGAAGPPRLWAFDAAGRPAAARTFGPIDGACTALAASPDGSRVYAGTDAGRCGCWEVATGRLEYDWEASAEVVAAVAVSPDGKAVATAGRGEPVRVWDAATGQLRAELGGSGGATALAFLPAGPAGWWLAAAGWDNGSVLLFDSDGREFREAFLGGHTGPVLAVAAGPDGSTLASAGQDAGVCVWDVPTGTVRILLRGHDHPVRAVRFDPDGKALYTGDDDGTVKVWDLSADPEGRSDRRLPAGVRAVAARPDGAGFAAALTDGSVAVYAQPGGTATIIPPRPGHGRLAHLAFPADGLPTGVEVKDAEASVWEFGSPPRLAYFAKAADGAAVTAVDLAVGADAGPGRLAVGDDRGRVTVWSLADRAVGSFDTGLGGPVRHLCLSDNGRWAAALLPDRSVGVWEVGGSRPPYRIPAHPDGLYLLRFLPGGDRLVTTGVRSSIKVWRVDAGREELSLLGHVGRVSVLAASPDGRTLMSGSQTGEVKLWDLRTGQELVGLKRHAGRVTAADFGAGGELLVTGGDAGGRGDLAFWEAAKE